MPDQSKNTMMRELSADELLAFSGAKPMEAEASRYTVVDLGPMAWAYSQESGCQAVRFGGEAGVVFWGCPSEQATVDAYTPKGFL